MKAPDIVESWLWNPGEDIIERLLARSSRTIGVPIMAPAHRSSKDRYYRMFRRFHVKRLIQSARRMAA